MENEIQREKIGQKASFVAIFGNIFLTIFNFTVGIFSGSTALVAEGTHTLSDVITSVMAYFGFMIGMRPADEEHHYGHGRAEPIVGIIIVAFLGVVAFEILFEVYKKLMLGEALTPPDLIAAGMALIGIFVNYAMTNYLINAGKKINSPVLIADGRHQSVDIYSCAAILIGVIGSRLGFTFLDPLVAVFIAIMVLKTAYVVARDSVNALMGKVPDPTILRDIESAALSLKDVQGVHSVKINNMGPYASAELHIELDKNLRLEESHKISHRVEEEIINQVKPLKMVIVHTCPSEEECELD
ncbi:cation diffusion facilitator family transporter [Methanobacterium sp. 42_16]|uniref:cation diffusion facilitator family transporter n=1 Tax=Methanobacterium sp. 42_16 TaxID=1641383 RepID=UPI000A72279C|nr:cation diffusion facilitator family transporter [Methanobacterium sp. 42_16]